MMPRRVRNAFDASKRLAKQETRRAPASETAWQLGWLDGTSDRPTRKLDGWRSEEILAWLDGWRERIKSCKERNY